MCSEFIDWYTANYFEEDFEDKSEYKDHQRTCYTSWQAAKSFYTK